MKVKIFGREAETASIPGILAYYGRVVVWMDDSEAEAIAAEVEIRQIFAAEIASGEVEIRRGYQNGHMVAVANVPSEEISDDEFLKDGKFMRSWKVGHGYGVSTSYAEYLLKKGGRVFSRALESGGGREHV